MDSQFMQPMPQQCKTCIFRASPDSALALSPERLAEITQYLLEGTQHCCHTDASRVCRGGRDLQLQVFYAMGLIAEPTDAALEISNDRFLSQLPD
jgi:hypothetical protein